MNLSERTEGFLSIYRLVPNLLTGPLTTDSSEEMIAFLLARGTLDKLEDARPLLPALDDAVARALRRTTVPWWLEVTRISFQCGFVESPWWKSILRLAAEVEEPALRKAG